MVGKILSVPVGDAFVERIISVVESASKCYYRRMRGELVKAEWEIEIHFDTSSEAFHSYLFPTLHPQKLQAAKLGKKICDLKK